jgi:hypothetical protein
MLFPESWAVLAGFRLEELGMWAVVAGTLVAKSKAIKQVHRLKA